MAGLIWINLFESLMKLMKELFEKLDSEKISRQIKKHEKFPRGQRVKDSMSMRAYKVKYDMFPYDSYIFTHKHANCAISDIDFFTKLTLPSSVIC